MATHKYKLICPCCGHLELAGAVVESICFKCNKCKSTWYVTIKDGTFILTNDEGKHELLHELILKL